MVFFRSRLRGISVAFVIALASTFSVADLHAASSLVISGTPATTAPVGSAYVFAPVARDTSGHYLTFSIHNQPPWTNFDSSTGRLTGTPANFSVGRYASIVISVTNGQTSASLAPFAIDVPAAGGSSGGNSAPVISGAPPTSAPPGTQYVFQPKASDANGDWLRFTIANQPPWTYFDSSTGRLTGTPANFSVGTYANIVISVSDGRAFASLAPFAINVAAAGGGGSSGGNSAPVISGTPPTSAPPGTQYVFQPKASDANGDWLTFSIANQPPWTNFDSSTGRLTGTPASFSVGTYANIVISVTDRRASASLAPFSINVPAAGGGGSSGGNAAPVISGTPATSALPGTQYVFQPMASDANGDRLTFSIANQPPWTNFDSSTGRLTGTPASFSVGTYANIVISVSDGKSSAALRAFSIAVQAVASGSATLSWQAPTQNTDGSPLTNLAGFKLYWGNSAGTYPNSVTIDRGLSTYVVGNLLPGTWYFAMTAVNSAGVESARTSPVSKTVK